MQVLLYDRNLSNPNVIANLSDRHEGMVFSTKLHGGFNMCKWRMKMDLSEAWSYIEDKTFYRVVIQDGAKLLWEGRIQDVAITVGRVEVTAYGYYASLNDQIYTTAYNANADVVIKAILTAVCPSINSDQTHIDATGGPAITSAADSSYLDITARALVENLSVFGDTSGNAWYFAVWDNRIPYFFKRDLTKVNWKANLSDLKRFTLKHRASELYNKVYAGYQSAGAFTRTADASNTASQNKYGVIRYYGVPDLGIVASVTAESARDTFLAEHKDIWPTLENITLGDKIYDTNRASYASNHIRAGDILRITDLVPASGDLDSVTLDAKRTFYVMETSYNVDNQENSLVVDRPSQKLDALIARTL